MNDKLNEYKTKFLEMYNDTTDSEINEIVRYIKKYDRFDMISNELLLNYSTYEANCVVDENGNKYVVHNGRRVYFPSKYDINEVQWRYVALIKEQDYFSPHRYLNDRSLSYIRNAKNEGLRIVIVEMGAMEGMFSLELEEIADEIYLFEPDKDWYEALKKTFKAGNVKIFDKKVDNYNDDETITIDSVDIDVSNALLIVKADIEGKEIAALESMKRTIGKSTKFLGFICAYHKEKDYAQISEFFNTKEYKLEHNRGYFLFYADENYKKPFIRRCVVRIYR